MSWATVEDLYAYWPSLANIAEMTDERLRQHIEEAEEIVKTDVESLGFKIDERNPRTLKVLRRLTILKALSTILIYPFGEGGTPGRYTRAAVDIEARYQAELKWATRTYGALNTSKRTPWGPIVK